MKATIKDLKINMDKALNNATKKELVKIVQEEFMNQTTQLNTDRVEAERKVMEDYKKEVGYKKLRATVDKAERLLEQARADLEEVGLGINGNKASSSQYIRGEYVAHEAVARINKRIDEATIAMRRPENVKNKVVARIHMASTMGEACVILNEVLGNGLIPTVQKSELLAIAHKKEV